jgi:anti-anti-sigma factor
MEIFESRDGNRLILSIKGHLDTNSAPALVEHFGKVKKGAEAFTLDFSSLAYLSSTGIRSLVVMIKDANATGKSLKIINVPPHIREVFRVTGIEDIFVRDEGMSIIETENTPSRLVFTFAGTLDTHTEHLLPPLFTRLLKENKPEIVFDISKLDKKSESALNLVRWFDEQLKKGQRKLTLIGFSDD